MASVWHDAHGDLVVGRVKTAWQGFKGMQNSMKRKLTRLQFALRDNVLEVAVGLIVANAFTAVVTSLVSDVLLPPISLFPFMDRNLEEKFLVLRRGPHYNETVHGYTTLDLAAADGAVTLAYGLFIINLVRFFVIALVLYLLAQAYSTFSKDSIITKTTKCGLCRKSISVKAKRCAFCTSWQDGRDEHEAPITQ